MDDNLSTAGDLFPRKEIVPEFGQGRRNQGDRPVGIEHPDDLLADLESAFAALGKVRIG